MQWCSRSRVLFFDEKSVAFLGASLQEMRRELSDDEFQKDNQRDMDHAASAAGRRRRRCSSLLLCVTESKVAAGQLFLSARKRKISSAFNVVVVLLPLPLNCPPTALQMPSKCLSETSNDVRPI